VHVNDWRITFYAGHTADNAEGKKKAFQRARTSLVDAGDLSVSEDVYYLARIPEAKP